MIGDYFTEKRRLITGFLNGFLEDRGRSLARAGGNGPDLSRRVAEFAARGKMIRGGLVFLGAELFSNDDTPGSVECASAMELLQSFLLIHDDVMDGDELRRGKPSFHAAYAADGRNAGIKDSAQYGESMAICAGDVTAFLAFELIAEAPITAESKATLTKTLAREIALVGIAQMNDVHDGVAQSEPGLEHIRETYRYKTGRYTFSLPLILGAMLAGAGDDDITRLGDLGESLGIIFQVKDDELGLVGSEAEIGKPAGADIRENKKTIHRLLLLSRSDEETRRRCERVFGARDVAESDLRFIRAALQTPEISRAVSELVETEQRTVEEVLSRSAFQNRRAAATLRSLIEYNLGRTR